MKLKRFESLSTVFPVYVHSRKDLLGGGVGVDKLQSYRKVFVNSKRNKKIFSFSCTKPFHIGNDFA